MATDIHVHTLNFQTACIATDENLSIGVEKFGYCGAFWDRPNIEQQKELCTLLANAMFRYPA